MQTTKRLSALLLTVLLSLNATLAQLPQRSAPPAEVQIILQPEQVRFTTPTNVEQMRLQVFDQNGALVFDSQPLAVNQLDWRWLGPDGNPVKSGLYAYTLTIKETGKAADAATERVRRGHFIVDRAKERDGQSDRVWLTSQSDTSVGTEATVSRNEDTVIAGTRTLSDRVSASGRDTAPRSIEEATTEQGVKPDLKTAAAAAPAATVGQIAKFTTATVVGDSVMTELGGNIGIGMNPASGYRLDVNGAVHLLTAPGTNNGEIAFATPNTETGMTILRNTGRADVRFDGSTLKLAAGPAGGPPGPAVAINTLGNVGIGTTAPQNRLHVGPGSSSILASRVNAVVASGSVDAGIAIAQNSGVNVLLQASGAGGYIGTTTNHPLVLRTNDLDRVVVAPNGNVGFGTGAPATKLHVESPGFAEIAIKSTNERAILSLNNGLNPQGYVWTIESGVGGRFPSLFGIYNRNVNKSGLEIDGNLLVYVKALQINGGADFAENFDVRAENPADSKATAEIQPGMVVAIDPANPGKLSLGRRAYDRRVAGIISGAGGVQPGMTMGQEQTLADGKYPVALSGRVYCWVDATRGAIKPGDLLTTSATPGHAMKVTNSTRAQGSIIGKAMTGLKTGKGLVLVLVTLQ